jgi:hypothetical protein
MRLILVLSVSVIVVSISLLFLMMMMRMELVVLKHGRVSLTNFCLLRLHTAKSAHFSHLLCLSFSFTNTSFITAPQNTLIV